MPFPFRTFSATLAGSWRYKIERWYCKYELCESYDEILVEKKGVEKWLTPYLTNYEKLRGPVSCWAENRNPSYVVFEKREWGVSGMHLSINFCTHNHHQKSKGGGVKLLHQIGWNCHVTSGRHTHTFTYLHRA